MIVVSLSITDKLYSGGHKLLSGYINAHESSPTLIDRIGYENTVTEDGLDMFARFLSLFVKNPKDYVFLNEPLENKINANSRQLFRYIFNNYA